MNDSVLKDIKVIDLTQHIAGPYCTKLLADYGADVIKIERPGGDPARRMGPFPGHEPHPEKSGLFLYLNTNKRGVTLDLKSDGGRAALLDLVRDADVLVESYSPRVMPSLGLDYQTLSKVNPKLVMTSVSSFGRNGRYSEYRATELVLYALCGMAYITGGYHREPVKHGYNQAQYLGGVAAASGTVAALLGLWRNGGEGQQVDVSILECAISTLFTTFLDYTYAGMVSRRQPSQGSSLRYPAPTKEGYILPTPGVMGDWDTYAAMAEVPELQDPKFATPADRQLHSGEVDDLLKAKWLEKTAEEWFHHAQEWRFPFSPVNTMEDISGSLQLKDRGYFVEFPHPAVGTLRYPGAPFRMSETPRRQAMPAPTLGQHNAEILQGAAQ
jgi:crotonobetainyl-CoA:carnitine CoA-transferase CaiB-like acyl-CoA transferase